MRRSIFLIQALLAFALAIYFATHQAPAQGLSPRGMWDEFRPMEPQPPEWMTEEYQFPEYKEYSSKRPIIQPAAPEMREFFPFDFEPGAIVIDNASLTLYYILGGQTNAVYTYPISIGREGFSWTGKETISRIQEWPEWIPPKEMLERRPDLPARMEGGINNPLGAVAMYLGNTLYRIHGTNDPKSIGWRESSGCIRMLNEHAVHLASMVHVGTPVYVIADLKKYNP